MSKRTLDSFFKSPASKKVKTQHEDVTPPPIRDPLRHSTQPKSKEAPKHDAELSDTDALTYTSHPTYPFPIANLPTNITETIENLLITARSKPINDQPHLDLLYFQPLIPQPTATDLFKHLRSTLPFYRVKYTITRFGKELQINTPRYTTVFGLDETSRFNTISTPDTSNPQITKHTTTIVETSNQTKQVSTQKYKCTPRPIPPALSLLLNVTEALTGDTFNFCLVNYYATGTDSISYHSDDERFLGTNPSIASFTLGARRDFLMKHKPPPPSTPTTTTTPTNPIESTPLKLSLSSGDMLLMRGETQSNWLHSIPKRKGGDADKGRINITLRRAMVPAGTENYYRYNVGEGEVYRWCEVKREMVLAEEMGRA